MYAPHFVRKAHTQRELNDTFARLEEIAIEEELPRSALQEQVESFCVHTAARREVETSRFCHGYHPLRSAPRTKYQFSIARLS
jgi:hypothetical protein